MVEQTKQNTHIGQTTIAKDVKLCDGWNMAVMTEQSIKEKE